jgi:CheY-like chemotaxis protein
MGIPLRALIVEDSRDDAVLLVKALERGGFDVAPTVVATAEAMAKALDSGEWDIVFADYVLPQFSGLEALELLHAKGIQVPFIFVSGKMDGRAGQAVLEAGAQDWISKNGFPRLVPSVKRELSEYEEYIRMELNE